MPKRERIDKLLVERGLAESRAKAHALVIAGLVVAGDQRIDKPGQLVDVEKALRLKGPGLRFVSRGGLKLEGALDHFHIDVTGLRCVDLGASTGGFTDCLLQRGALDVVCVDVGRGQLHEKLRQDPRVTSYERINARQVTLVELGAAAFDLAVMDLSFISLTLVLPAAIELVKPGGQLVMLVKPQFEAGPEHVGKGGVVRDESVRALTIEKVTKACRGLGVEVRGIVDASIDGPAGNREALLWALRPG